MPRGMMALIRPGVLAQTIIAPRKLPIKKVKVTAHSNKPMVQGRAAPMMLLTGVGKLATE